MFIGFANFYRRFIRGFSRIAALLTSILKMTGLSQLALKGADDKVVGGCGSRVDETMKNLSKSRKLKNDKYGNSTYVLNPRR